MGGLGRARFDFVRADWKSMGASNGSTTLMVDTCQKQITVHCLTCAAAFACRSEEHCLDTVLQFPRSRVFRSRARCTKTRAAQQLPHVCNRRACTPCMSCMQRVLCSLVSRMSSYFYSRLPTAAGKYEYSSDESLLFTPTCSAEFVRE